MGKKKSMRRAYGTTTNTWAGDKPSPQRPCIYDSGPERDVGGETVLMTGADLVEFERNQDRARKKELSKHGPVIVRSGSRAGSR